MHSRRSALLACSTFLLAAPVMARAQGGVPVPFTLLSGERTSVPFAAAAAGTVTVQVQAKGEPLLVVVSDPLGKAAAQQQGTGVIALEVPVTPTDVKSGAYWLVSVRAAREGVVARAAMRAEPRPVASGSITLGGVVITGKELAAMLAPREAAAREQVLASLPKAPAGVPAPDLAVERAALATRSTAAQTAQLQTMAARLPAPTVAQMQQRIALRARGAEPASIAVSDRRMGVTRQPPGVMSQGQAASGASPVGSSSGAAVASAPTISNLSVRQGEPGTPVMIDGTGFGDAAGEVHFVVASGSDLVAPVMSWAGTQLVVEVPGIVGVPAYNGFVYVKRADGSKTTLLPFTFQPTLDVGSFCVQAGASDNRIGTPGEPARLGSVGAWHFTAMAGFAGYDEYNLQARLLNGWRVERVEIRDWDCNGLGAGHPKDNPNSGAYVVDWRQGSDSPYVKVRWWMDGAPLVSNYVTYTVAIVVTGPKGLAYR